MTSTDAGHGDVLGQPGFGRFGAAETVSFVPLLAGVVIAVFAQVWSHGVSLKNDLDGLV